MKLTKDDYFIGAFGIVMLLALCLFLNYMSKLPDTPQNLTCMSLKCDRLPGRQICTNGRTNLTICYEDFNMTCSWIENNDTLCRSINHPRMDWGNEIVLINPQDNNCSDTVCNT